MKFLRDFFNGEGINGKQKQQNKGKKKMSGRLGNYQETSKKVSYTV